MPKNISKQLSSYEGKPKLLPSGLGAAIIRATMGNNHGYTPADAAEDLKQADGKVLIKNKLNKIFTKINQSFITN